MQKPPQALFHFLKTIHIFAGFVFFPFVLTQSVKTAAADLQLH